MSIPPLLAAGGLMGYTGITLNAGSAMNACIAFGLVVDDTLHFLHHAKEAIRRGDAPHAAVRHVFEKVGFAILYSSILLSAGFAILMLGQSYFTFSFGLLCAFTIVSALSCELLITPLLVFHSEALRRGLKS